MDQRYLANPYSFIPPYRSTIWCRLVRPIFRRILRKSYLLERFETRGQEKMVESVRAGKGVLLAGNHCRYSDPFVMGEVSRLTHVYLYFCASWHLFQASRWQSWLLNRMGAMSIYREGADRDCIRECQSILERAERPLVLFPEGTFYRQNDRLGPLQDGVSFIARLAQKKDARDIVVHPFALKYWFLEDPNPAIERRLCQLEQRCHCHPKRGQNFVDRLRWIANALLTVKEMELIGAPQEGDLETRQASLAERVCSDFETRYFKRPRSGETMERIRLIRNHIVKQFVELPSESPEWYEHLYQIEDLAFAQQLVSHSWRYLEEWPSAERISETLMRLEEDLYDQETPMAAMGVVIEIGDAISVREYAERKGKENGSAGDPLTRTIGSRIQGMLDGMARSGPPSHWPTVTKARPVLDTERSSTASPVLEGTPQGSA